MNEFKMGFKKKIPHPLPEWILTKDFEIGIELTLTDLVSLLVACGIVWVYFQKKYWALNNVLGICFCLQGIERLSLGTYKIGAILLVGLFFYDIFWVFGTDVMVTVATKFDAPIKVIFPRNLWALLDGQQDVQYSMLGLGDIVIPGVFL